MRVHNESDESIILDMFNNDNTPSAQGGPSTGLRLSIDLVQKSVSTVHALTDPEDPIRSVSQGSYRVVPNTSNGVLGYGSISKLKEFDEAGNIVLTAQFGENDTVASYRGYKYEWSAIPFWSPDAVASPQDNNQTLVSMSWNGATTVTDWEVYSVQSAEPLEKTLVQKFPRAGFETSVTVDLGGSTLVQVIAMEGDKPLRESEIVSVIPEPAETSTEPSEQQGP